MAPRISAQEVESQPHPNSLIYNDGAANSPPSPYASLAFRGRRWQAPIGSPSTLADGYWVGLQFHGLLFVGWVDGAGYKNSLVTDGTGTREFASYTGHFLGEEFFFGNFTNLVSYGFGKSTIFLSADKFLLLTHCKNFPCLHSVRVQSYTV